MSRKRLPRRAPNVREVAAFVLLACACGAAVSDRPGAAPAPSSSAPPAAASGEPAPPPSEPFDDLVARAPSLAPGMHEAARKAGTGEPVELWRADAGDACVRVAFAASVPVTPRLLLKGNEVLATTPSPSLEGALGDRGPVCVRKGDTIRAAADPPDAHVRWLLWQAP